MRMEGRHKSTFKNPFLLLHHSPTIFSQRYTTQHMTMMTTERSPFFFGSFKIVVDNARLHRSNSMKEESERQLDRRERLRSSRGHSRRSLSVPKVPSDRWESSSKAKSLAPKVPTRAQESTVAQEAPAASRWRS